MDTRTWSVFDGCESTTSGGNNIRIMQWNILADVLAASPNSKGELETSFVKTPMECLAWSYRLPLILRQISICDPDIVCLQEVDRFDDICIDGYDKIFYPKTSSPCTQFQPNNGPDGCAMLFKTDKLTLIERRDIPLLDESNNQTNQVALLARFNIKGSVGDICIGNTHFKAKSGFEALRVAQGACLLRSLKEMSAPIGPHCPVVVCGDFNAVPSEDVCKLFRLAESGPLSSAYAMYNGSDPAFTTVKYRANGLSKYTGDYIWYNSSSLAVNKLYDLMTEDTIGVDIGLPNRTYPSDHMALCADFRIKQ